MDISFDTVVEDLKKAGVKVLHLEPKELDAWNTAARYQDVQTAWATQQEGKGVEDAVLVVKKIDTIINATKK